MESREIRAVARVSLADVAPSTASEYARAAARLGGQHWRDYASAQGLARKSVTVIATAWRRERARAALDGLRRSDAARKSGDRQRAQELRREAAAAAQELIDDQNAGAYQPPDAGTKRRKNTKRSTLPKNEWRPAVLRELRRPVDRVKATLLAATGARPEELRKGVELSISDDGRLVAYIQGAKVSQRTQGGQEWRRLSLPNNPFTRALKPFVEANGGTLPVAGGDDAFRKRVERAMVRAGYGGLSLYSFRHQFAADEKGSGLNDDELSAALGHASAVSRKHYGHARQARGKGGVRATAAQSVRSPEALPDMGPTGPSLG